MGGNKHKGQAQRTKNNAKPANSGRIAELVDKGHQFPSFSGFSDTRPTNQPVSNISIDVFSSNVDPNFTVVLKKMNKKDATTRFKALQELKELCNGSSPEVIVEVLPVWCKVYTLLAIDVEHRVREAVQEVHRLIVSRVGRNLAPHLKVITPLWFLSQYDSYAPAASMASAAFEEAFPPHKVNEVIAFCQAEILQYIQGNLLTLTPQALSKGDLSKEEMELKYERIIICSLNGLALYLSKVPTEQIKKFESVHKEILSSPKFWKFSKYKSPGVRSAWFALLSSICQHAIHLIDNEKKHVANSVIGGIDDYDSSVLSVVWEAALRSFSSIQDFWEFVNIDKFFLPKFANILRVGGQGNASCIYPNILLLLNSIPSSVIKDKEAFFGKIFSSFQEGMSQPLVYQSPSESEAVISSFIECIQYLIMKNIEDETFCLFILGNVFQVMPLTMTNSNFGNLIKPFYRHLYQMLSIWQKNDSINLKYALLQKTVWEKLFKISNLTFLEALIDKEKFQLCINAQLTMITVLDSPILIKRKLKVSFANDIGGEPSSQPQNEPTEQLAKNEIQLKLESNLLELGRSLMQMYYKYALDDDYKQYKILLIAQIQKIMDLLKDRISESVKSLQPDWTMSLLFWIQSDDIPIKNIVGMIFETLSFLEHHQKEKIILQLTEKRCHESLIEGLKLATMKDCSDLNDWLHSDTIKEEICREYEKVDSPSSFRIIKNVLLTNKRGEFVIGSDTVQALVAKIKDQFSSSEEIRVRIASEAVNVIIENISEAKLNNHEDLLFELLQPLFVNIVHGKGHIVYETWLKGVLLLVKSHTGQQLLETHLRNMSTELGTYITSMETIFDVKLIHRSVLKLLSILVGNDEHRMEAFGMPCIRLLLTSVFTQAVSESRRRIEDVCLVAEVINGNLPFDKNSDRIDTIITSIIDKWSPLDRVNTLGFVNSLVFSLKVIASALGIDIDSDNIGEGDEDEDGSDSTVSLPVLQKETTHEFCEYLVELTYGLVLLKKIQSYYYATREYFSIACFVEPLEKDVRELVQRCKKNEQEEIISMITNKCNTEGCLWAQVKEHIMDFLDGTVEESTALVLREDETLIPTSILSVPVIHKLRNKIKNRGLSQVLLNESLKVIGDRYKEQYPTVEKALNNEDRDFLILSAKVARLFETAIATSPLLLSLNTWDFARISVVHWLDRISKTVNLKENYIEFVTLTNAVCSLFTTICKTFMDPALSSSLSEYCVEWKDVFVPDAFFYLCKAWENVIEERCSNLNHVGFIHFETLGSTLCTLCSMDVCEWKSRSGIHEWVKLAMTGILIPFVPVQLTSYKLLLLFLPAMMELDENLDESSLNSVSFKLLEEKLFATQIVVMAMLQDYSTGVSCSVSPFTDSYVYTLGYLLLWSALLQCCNQCHTQQKYLYPLWIKEKNIVPSFIEAVVKLMPECVLYYQESSNKRGQELFTSTPSMSFSGWTSEKLSHLSCWLLTELMGNIPAVVRQWASEAEPKQLAFVDRITTAFISPFLCSREMEAIKGQQKSFDNMKVFTYPTVGEVIAVYTVEESSTELSIQLSNNYPLSPPKVDISKAMVSSIQTRQWLKQLTIFLTHQNGSIWDGLILWKNNLDKKFEGIDECYICFSILHTTTHQLPKLSCHTCKKKFHSFCLYKWFSTSNKSTCPICRAIF